MFRAIRNAITIPILVVSLIVCGIFSFFAYLLYKEFTRNRHVSTVVNIDPQAEIKLHWELREMHSLSGTDYLMASASSKQSYQMSHYEKEATAARNYLFINAVDKSMSWLLPHNNFLFLSNQRLSKKDHDDAASLSNWMKYSYIKDDSNRDQRLTGQDKISIAISDVTGKGFTEVLENIDFILGSYLRDEDVLLIFYERNEKDYLAEINLPKKQVTDTRELPKTQ